MNNEDRLRELEKCLYLLQYKDLLQCQRHNIETYKESLDQEKYKDDNKFIKGNKKVK